MDEADLEEALKHDAAVSPAQRGVTPTVEMPAIVDPPVMDDAINAALHAAVEELYVASIESMQASAKVQTKLSTLMLLLAKK